MTFDALSHFRSLLTRSTGKRYVAPTHKKFLCRCPSQHVAPIGAANLIRCAMLLRRPARCGLQYFDLVYNHGATGSTTCSWISLQADTMTLIARTVAADSRRFSQRPVILDGMIAFPPWTDQFGNLPLPGGPNSGGLTVAFAKTGRCRFVRCLHATTRTCRRLPGMCGRSHPRH
jgi:hypothetical protein